MQALTSEALLELWAKLSSKAQATQIFNKEIESSLVASYCQSLLKISCEKFDPSVGTIWEEEVSTAAPFVKGLWADL